MVAISLVKELGSPVSLEWAPELEPEEQATGTGFSSLSMNTARGGSNTSSKKDTAGSGGDR